MRGFVFQQTDLCMCVLGCYLNQESAGHRPIYTWFLEITFSNNIRVCVCVCVLVYVCVCVCMCVCACEYVWVHTPSKLLITTSGEIWGHILVKQVLQLLYGICSQHHWYG